MNTLFAEPKTASQAAYVCRVVERANSLWLDGYTFKTDEYGDIFAVIKPGHKWEEIPPLNEGIYATDTEGCSCKSFKKDGECKHHIAVVLKQAELDEIRDSRMW